MVKYLVTIYSALWKHFPVDSPSPAICFSCVFTPSLLLSLSRPVLVPFQMLTFEGGEFFLAVSLCGLGCVHVARTSLQDSAFCIQQFRLYFSPAREDRLLWANPRAQPFLPAHCHEDGLSLGGTGSLSTLSASWSWVWRPSWHHSISFVLLLKSWGLGFTSQGGLLTFQKCILQVLSELCCWSFLHFFQLDLHYWDGMSICLVASSFRSLLLCKDGVCVPASRLPCGMEVGTVGVVVPGNRGWFLGRPAG